MMEMWTGPEFTKRHRGRMGIMGSIATLLGVVFAILGIIGEASLTIIGLCPTSWYLLAIASLIFSLGCWLGWAVGIYLHARETENKKQEA
jgi:ABC-type long-subunit fatty acid transport system fused permease/ATPase subunit